MDISYRCITEDGVNTSESVVAVLSSIVLARAPVIFDPVKFTVERRREHYKMPPILNNLLDATALAFTVRLRQEHGFCATGMTLKAISTGGVLDPVGLLTGSGVWYVALLPQSPKGKNNQRWSLQRGRLEGVGTFPPQSSITENMLHSPKVVIETSRVCSSEQLEHQADQPRAVPTGEPSRRDPVAPRAEF
jgi:hypothetical protein